MLVYRSRTYVCVVPGTVRSLSAASGAGGGVGGGRVLQRHQLEA